VRRRWKTTIRTADRALSVITFFTRRFKRFSLAALVAALYLLNVKFDFDHFTMDIYKQYINKMLMIETTVNVETYFRAVALLIVIMAPPWADCSISIYTRIYWCGESWYFSGIHIGIVLEKTSNKAIWGALLSIPIAMFLK
jgi:hypothetical protein